MQRVARVQRFEDRMTLQALKNIDEPFLDEIADGQFRFQAAGIDVAVRLDCNLRTRYPVIEKVLRAGPARTEIRVHRRGRQTVLPGAAAWPEFGYPFARLRAEEHIKGAVFRQVIAPARGIGHGRESGALEHMRQLFDERLALRSLHADMVVVEACHGDHPDAALAKLVENFRRYDVARRLHADPGTAGAILLAYGFHRGVKKRLAYRVDQQFAARHDDPADTLRRRAVGVRMRGIEIGHGIGQVRDDAAIIADAFADDRFQLVPDIRPKACVVAVPALAMASIGEDVVDGFHCRGLRALFAVIIADRGSRLASNPRECLRKAGRHSPSPAPCGGGGRDNRSGRSAAQRGCPRRRWRFLSSGNGR
jgi:hypothetical protein